MTLPDAPAAITTMFPDDRSVQDDFSCRFSTFSSGDTSPFELSPWNQTSSPFSKSPWSTHHPVPSSSHTFSSSSIASPTELVASLVREEGHIYSLAASGNLLYTGSDSKNIRVWKDLHDFAAFKSTSGLVKAIVISSDRIFTGHQDGKIRIWKVSPKKPEVHKRAGTLPKLRDYLMMSLKPSNYVEVRRNRNALWIKHFDAVSCLALSEDNTLLYSGSWDKTFKVWRISDSKCLESVSAHDDAVNAVVSAFDSLVFSGSADGTVKVWCREVSGKTARHVAVKTLLSQDSAVTCLAVSHSASIVYCGSSDGMVNFWEKELKHGGILRGHKLAVLCLAAAGSLLVSGSADKSMCVWRREGTAHACLSILSGHEGPVKCLAIARESKKKKKKAEGEEDEDGNWMVYSGSLDKSVKVWKVSEGLYEKMLDGHREAMNEKQQQQGSFSSPCIM